jgi:hypothetical protein
MYSGPFIATQGIVRKMLFRTHKPSRIWKWIASCTTASILMSPKRTKIEKLPWEAALQLS